MAEAKAFNPTPKQLGMGAIGLIIIYILVKSIIVIPAGHVGVKVLFGNVQELTLDEGLHLVNPLMDVEKMSIRTQQISETATVPSQEGLNVKLDVSVLFSLDPRAAATVYQRVGPRYAGVVVVPQLRSVVRGVTAGYDAKALYTSKREAISVQMDGALRPEFKKRGITLEKVMLRSVTLPSILSTAIEKKLEAEQQAQQMKFVLEREKRQADRKRIEAKGISDYNREVSKGLTNEVLRLRGIEATRELASSNNSKVVVIGDSDGMPLILGNTK